MILIQGAVCAVRNVLKCGQLSGAWNFLYSGMENCESAAPRPRFPQIPPQAALRRSLRRVRRAAPGQPDIRFRAAVARLSDPCGPADGQAERFAGCRADGSLQKMEQRKRLPRKEPCVVDDERCAGGAPKNLRAVFRGAEHGQRLALCGTDEVLRAGRKAEVVAGVPELAFFGTGTQRTNLRVGDQRRLGTERRTRVNRRGGKTIRPSRAQQGDANTFRPPLGLRQSFAQDAPQGCESIFAKLPVFTARPLKFEVQHAVVDSNSR